MKLGLSVILCGIAAAQDATHQHAPAPIPLQPLAQQVRQLEEAMNYLGQPFATAELRRIHEAIANPDEAAAVRSLESILDAHVLLNVDINPESRVKVEEGAAKPDLVEAGTRLFLVKVINHGECDARRWSWQSPNSGNVYIRSNGSPAAAHEALPSGVQRALGQHLAVTSAHRCGRGFPAWPWSTQFSKSTAATPASAPPRSASMSDRAQQDIGFRNDVTVLFTALARAAHHPARERRERPAHDGVLHHSRPPRTASIPIPPSASRPTSSFSRRSTAPTASPCSFPTDYYTIEYTGGPEYLTRTRELRSMPTNRDVVSNSSAGSIPRNSAGISGDHHVHAAGCSHYMNPTEGVLPEDMMRQILGEHLNIGAVLTWGPDYYYQKQFFSAKDDPLSTARPPHAL